MGSKIRQFGALALGLTILLAVLCIPAVFVLGARWFAEKALPPLIGLCWLAIAIDALALLCTAFRRARPAAGTVIFFSSFLLGLTSWLVSFVLTYELWGTFAVLMGVMAFGGAVVPFALVATALKGMWAFTGLVAVLFALTWAARVGGVAIVAAGEA
ncbi:hypothetical protein [Ramlibacter sp.]|uniref:hypothetical protein n=1 Tax=Ramlibacter sp. TaxID=1917967 RepID=UPI0026202C23|nr:hypothetical protein [Ramlibacter sp.]MDB5956750.1 hypothetical protein [Ramlibacter sp.]